MVSKLRCARKPKKRARVFFVWRDTEALVLTVKKPVANNKGTPPPIVALILRQDRVKHYRTALNWSPAVIRAALSYDHSWGGGERVLR